MLARMQRKGAFLYYWGDCSHTGRFFKKLKIELPYDPAIVLLGVYSKNTKILIQRDICTPIYMLFIAALSTLAKLWKELKCPSVDEWIKM